jgi:hypothetical protein
MDGVSLDRIDDLTAKYEDLICRIQGVFSARVKIDENSGVIVECHVLADKSRNVKQLVRDVQSALMAKFDVDVDYKLISVAQIDNLDDVLTMHSEAPTQESPVESTRLQLKSFLMGYEGMEIKAVVSLLLGGQTYVGEALGSGSLAGRGRTLAQAVVNAAMQCYNKCTLNVMDVQKFGINGQSAYAVALFCATRNREDVLLGAALIKEDENLCVVKATLDALNRRLLPMA